ncbi:MAG: hypothetical protein GY839_21715 [candidate division Zixibacteria bacterium]|nr:hypothetical protein [candidate division Zixibacteria bacterium]
MNRILVILIVALNFYGIDNSVFGNDSTKVDYYVPKNIYKFACYLYDNGDYQRAAGEYMRLLHFTGDRKGDTESVEYRIGLCYLRLDEHEKAMKIFRELTDHARARNYKELSHVQISYSLLLAGRFSESISYINSHQSDLEDDKRQLQMGYLKGLNYLYRRDWPAAYEIHSSLATDASDDSTGIWFGKYAKQGVNLPRKSGLVAGLLSTAIPGSGKMYAGRFTDGLYSLFIISLLGWQAYDGFKDDGKSSTKGWIYGSIGGVFYLGNIYGSTVAVKISNLRAEDELLDQVGAELRIHFD